MNPPIPHSYWVIPGKLLAGEYPRTIPEDKSREKLGAILRAGVTVFIDLTTKADRMERYDALLHELSEGRCRRLSFPITDLDVPKDPIYTRQILDAIDKELARGEVVYLHCWGGVGRTGTIVGCWLTRHGHKGEAAVQELARLWSACKKSWRSSPETPAQFAYIRSWQES
jgi:protein-tyrosine phosphatase